MYLRAHNSTMASGKKRQFGSLDEAVGVIRDQEGCALYANDLGPGASDVGDLT